MRRFLVPREAIGRDRVVFPPAESRHLAAVLRARAGDRVTVFDGLGTDYLIELTAVTPREVVGRVLEVVGGRASLVRITLVQGVPKAGKMDAIVRMGTELGIDAVLPVLTRRTVGGPTGARVQRWRRIAAAAARQSGRATVPEIHDPRPLRAAWPLLAGMLVLMPWEGERSRRLGDVLAAQRQTRAVAIVIGPEGGFAPEEVREGATRGAHVVSLGPLILRTETAGLVTAAMVLYELTLRP